MNFRKRRRLQQIRLNNKELATQHNSKPYAVNRTWSEVLDSARNLPNLGLRLNRIELRNIDVPATRRKILRQKLSPVKTVRSPAQEERTYKNFLKNLKVMRTPVSKLVDLPPEHPICVQREQRKEILFAKGKAGKGGQKPRKIPDVIIRCERRK